MPSELPLLMIAGAVVAAFVQGPSGLAIGVMAMSFGVALWRTFQASPSD